MNYVEELSKTRELINNEIRKTMIHENCYQEKIYESIEYSLFTGGKRLRPILLIKSFDMFNDKIDKAIPFAVAIEMIHTYSLIHDDLPPMDNDDYRRGKLTNHKVFGEDIAILAGDALLNLAFEIMLSYSVKNSVKIEDYKMNLSAINEISKYSGIEGMIGGQAVDVLSDLDKMNKEKLLFMYETKTAALIQASLVAGAILGGANDSEVEIMREYGLYLGLAYQIKDDLLDLEEDNKANKTTYISYFNEKDANRKICQLSERAIETLKLLDKKDITFFNEITVNLRERTK